MGSPAVRARADKFNDVCERTEARVIGKTFLKSLVGFGVHEEATAHLDEACQIETTEGVDNVRGALADGVPERVKEVTRPKALCEDFKCLDVRHLRACGRRPRVALLGAEAEGLLDITVRDVETLENVLNDRVLAVLSRDRQVGKVDSVAHRLNDLENAKEAVGARRVSGALGDPIVDELDGLAKNVERALRDDLEEARVTVEDTMVRHCAERRVRKVLVLNGAPDGHETRRGRLDCDVGDKKNIVGPSRHRALIDVVVVVEILEVDEPENLEDTLGVAVIESEAETAPDGSPGLAREDDLAGAPVARLCAVLEDLLALVLVLEVTALTLELDDGAVAVKKRVLERVAVVRLDLEARLARRLHELDHRDVARADALIFDERVHIDGHAGPERADELVGAVADGVVDEVARVVREDPRALGTARNRRHRKQSRIAHVEKRNLECVVGKLHDGTFTREDERQGPQHGYSKIKTKT